MHTDGDGKKLRLLCLQVLSATLRSGGYIPPVLTSGSTGHPCLTPGLLSYRGLALRWQENGFQIGNTLPLHRLVYLLGQSSRAVPVLMPYW